MSLFVSSAKPKYHPPGDLKQQNRVVSQFWRTEVQKRGAGRAALPRRPRGRIAPACSLSGGCCNPWRWFLRVQLWRLGLCIPHHVPLSNHVSTFLGLFSSPCKSLILGGRLSL